jgi:hypothetical protein
LVCFSLALVRLKISQIFFVCYLWCVFTSLVLFVAVRRKGGEGLLFIVRLFVRCFGDSGFSGHASRLMRRHLTGFEQFFMCWHGPC